MFPLNVYFSSILYVKKIYDSVSNGRMAVLRPDSNLFPIFNTQPYYTN